MIDKVEVGQPVEVEDSEGEVVDVGQPLGKGDRELHKLMVA